jgi:hypothetical protein
MSGIIAVTLPQKETRGDIFIWIHGVRMKACDARSPQSMTRRTFIKAFTYRRNPETLLRKRPPSRAWSKLTFGNEPKQ